MRNQFLQSPRLSQFGRRGGNATAAYPVNGLTPATVADYQAETYAAHGAPVSIASLHTFARSGAAVAHGADGYLDQFADEVILAPSYTLEDGSWVPGLTFEAEARSSIFTFSDIDNWTQPAGAVVTSGETGADGAASAFKLSDHSAGGTGTVRGFET